MSEMKQPVTSEALLGNKSALSGRTANSAKGTSVPRKASLKRTLPFSICALVLTSLGAETLAAQQFEVVSTSLVSSNPVSATQVDSAYRVSIHNSGAPAFGVTATVTSTSAASVVAGNLAFGDIAEDSIASSVGTITIRQDRATAFDPAALLFTFQTGSGNQPPIADAGADQSAKPGATVTLNGSRSHAPDGSIALYSWTYVGSVPAGISLSLSDPNSVTPQVYIPSAGSFTFQLVVTDNRGTTSLPAQVKVTTGPIADPGPNQTVKAGETVQLDGSASRDPEGLPLTFRWTLVSPAGSKAQLSSAAAVKPTFVADVRGLYTATLTTNNGAVSSAPAFMKVAATAPALSCGSLISGDISEAGQIDQYTYSALGGGVITLTLADTGGFNPGYPYYIVASATLYDPNGKPVVSFNANNQQQVTLALTGIYTIEVNASDLASTGTYNLGIVCRNPLQPVTTLTCGGIANGNIAASAQVDQYSYSAKAGGVITLTLSDTSGFNPGYPYYIKASATLFDPTGKAILSFNANSQQQVTLALTGIYVIQVIASDFASTGTYNLGLVCRNPLQPVNALSCGGIASGNIAASAQVDQYSYNAKAGGVVTLTLSDTSGFNPGYPYYIKASATLFDPTGKAILSFNANSQQQVALALTGLYVIQVYASDLATTGTYNLGLVCQNPLQPVNALSCGSLANGNIAASAQVDQYSYSAKAGGVVTLTLSDTSGFNPGYPYYIKASATLFDPTGKAILNFNANNQQQVTLALTGLYVIQVYASDLASTGTYNLGLVCRNPLQPANALGCGSLANGNIAASAQVDQYSYGGNKGENVTLTLSDTGGFNPGYPYYIVASATVFDPTGKAILNFNANSQQQITLPLSGTYVIQVDSSDLASTGTYNLGATCLPPNPAVVTYIGSDSATQGTWTDKYGANGQLIANDSTSSPPAYAAVGLAGDSLYTWAASTTDVRALQTASGASTRIASTYYSPTNFTITVNLTDGNAHRIGLYLLDWDSTARAETISFTDATSGATLSTQSFASFHNGVYAVWDVQGNVKITVTKNAGSNAVVSGIFFDAIPYATYSGLDTTTQGTWTGTYGSNGDLIANDANTPPSFAVVNFTGDNLYTWEASTSDVRALQTASGASTRIASAYYSPSSFTLNLNLTDGNTHKISLYMLDWDSTARTETISFLDPVSNTILDTEEYSSFHGGQYAVWQVQGHVLIQVTKTGGANAVLSGAFFD
jgi:hypothetical protein